MQTVSELPLCLSAPKLRHLSVAPISDRDLWLFHQYQDKISLNFHSFRYLWLPSFYPLLWIPFYPPQPAFRISLASLSPTCKILTCFRQRGDMARLPELSVTDVDVNFLKTLDHIAKYMPGRPWPKTLYMDLALLIDMGTETCYWGPARRNVALVAVLPVAASANGDLFVYTKVHK